VTNSKRNRSRRNGRIGVIVNWRHTDGTSPSLGRLMALLLKDRSEKSGVEKKDRLS